MSHVLNDGITTYYDPEKLKTFLVQEPETIVIWVPWFLSPHGWLYKKHAEFLGHVYLKQCAPVGMVEADRPTATITIEVSDVPE